MTVVNLGYACKGEGSVKCAGEKCGEIRHGCCKASDMPQRWLWMVLRCQKTISSQGLHQLKESPCRWKQHHGIPGWQWNGRRRPKEENLSNWKSYSGNKVLFGPIFYNLLAVQQIPCSYHHKRWSVFIYNTWCSSTASCRIGTLGICETTRLDWCQDQSSSTTVR